MEKNKSIIIFGSARSDGNTREALQLALGETPVETVDLSTLNLSYYDYESLNTGDDFLPLMEKVVQKDTIILATPVYWYTMSALMKTFLDRWSDVLTVRKDLGRALAGKKLFVVTSYGTSFPQDFETPFRLTCEYMGISYCGCYFHYSGSNPEKKARNIEESEKFQKRFFSYDSSDL